MTPSMKTLPRASRNFEKNIWADYAELACLASRDKEISLSDLAEPAKNEDYYEDAEQELEKAERDDSLYQQFSDVFKYIRSRASILNDDYPFEFIDEDTICLKSDSLNSAQRFYLFLLYASNLSRFERADRNKLTSYFESLSRDVLSLVCPNFTIEIFGTASKPDGLFHGGNVIDRLEKLATCLHTELSESTKKNDRYNQPSGDAGIDLIGFVSLENESVHAPFLPALFAQCACSHEEWQTKQSSIRHSTINPMFRSIAHYLEFIAVPFSLRDTSGQWENTVLDRIVVIPVDRVRFLHILRLFESDYSFFENSDAYQLIVDSLTQLGR